MAPAQNFDDDLYDASPGPSKPLSPSPAISTSSDKENPALRRPMDKGKGRAVSDSMGPPKIPTPAIKRKRTITNGVEDMDAERSQRRRTIEVDEDLIDADDYNPDQDVEERRQLRAGLRELTRNVQDNRAEYLNADSNGIQDTLKRANDLSGRVKQTSDATIDSRLLVTTADLARKKTLRLTSGDTAQGIDVDDFVAKLKAYMKSGGRQSNGHAQPRGTQRRRGGPSQHTDSDDEEDDGEMLNWEHLGRQACLHHNSRPSVPGFLLGPLSLQKRARKVVVRRAALKASNLEETRPEVLKAGDIEKSENANLTYLCTKIMATLKSQADKVADVVDDLVTDDTTEEEQRALMDRYGISDHGNLNFFKFVINPFSFGQTIENMFYVSFLIRDGKVGIEIDDNDMPYLEHRGEPEEGGGNTGHTARHQAILSFDMDEWEELIELFDIREPMIDHREEQDNSRVGAKGWYA